MSTLVNVLTSPGPTLDRLRSDGRAWPPIVAKLALVIGFWAWYFHTVDIEWLKNELFFRGDLAPDARAAIDDLVTPKFLTITTLTGELVIISVLFVGTSLYLWFAARAMAAEPPRLRRWASLVAWASVPTLLAPLVMGAYVLIAGHHVHPGALDPASLNSLVFGVAPDDRWAALVGSVNLFHLWTLALLAIGFSLWTRRRLAISAVIVGTPVVALLGGWAIAIWL